jgi:hypothetical protein
VSNYRSFYPAGYRPSGGYRVGAYGDGTASASSAFNPMSIPNAVLWVDGTTVPGADGAAIGTWTNGAPTGAGANPTQGTAGNKPLLKTGVNGINGVSVLRFDGIDDFMLNPVDTQGAGTDFLVFRLTATPGASTFYTPVLYKGSTGPVFDELLLANNAGYQPYTIKADYNNVSSSSQGIANALDTSAHVFSSTYSGGTDTLPASYTISLDGVSTTVVAGGVVAIVLTSLGSIGARVSVALAVTFPMAGDIGEIIRFSRVLTAAEIALVTSYLRTKWGI